MIKLSSRVAGTVPRRVLFAAMMLMAMGVPLASVAEEATMEERCRQEVVELHQFFQDWFNAELSDDKASFARFERVLTSDFEIIGPDGHRTERAVLLPGLRSGHGRNAEEPFAIDVRNVRSRVVGDGLVLVTYEEHQTTGGEHVAWQSSALFRARPGLPNGVEWLHVQETYLPGLGEVVEVGQSG